jgi:hypothetical protein
MGWHIEIIAAKFAAVRNGKIGCSSSTCRRGI